ncbi:hypothetical protein HAX54_046759 [Datura stramonium]|uniref:Uncharacterized protein n=1 Tax=Datura stramonium TaxID=4076 RepID=A0ABS8WHH1_DATST|nr:hypothetical protein [Datura stramonium]
MDNSNTQVWFGLERTEEYYVAFKEKCSIRVEAQFEVDSCKNAFPDIYDQIGMRDWGPFTIPVDPYFLELVGNSMLHTGPGNDSSSTRAAQMHYHAYRRFVCAGKRAKQQVTVLPFPSLMSMLCVWAACPLFRPLDRTVWDGSVITLAIKTDKDAPLMKRAKCTENRTPPPPSESSHTLVVQLGTIAIPTPTHSDFLKVEKRVQVHEIHNVKLAKAIPSMIQLAIKKSMQLARDKLKSLCSTVEVLEREVCTLRKEVAALSVPPSARNPIPSEPAVVPTHRITAAVPAVTPSFHHSGTPTATPVSL